MRYNMIEFTKKSKELVQVSASVVRTCLLLTFTCAAVGVAFPQSKYIKTCQEASTLGRDGKLAESAVRFNEAVGLDAGKALAYGGLAHVLYLSGSYDEALTSINKAIGIEPGNEYLPAIRGNIYRKKGINDLAIADYTSALQKLKPDDKTAFDCYSFRGDIYFLTRKYNEAIADYTRSIEITGKNDISSAYFYYQRAMSYMYSLKYNEAINDFNTLLSLRPGLKMALFYRGYAYMKSGNQSKADECAREIIEKEPARAGVFSGDVLTELFNLDVRRVITLDYLVKAETSIAEFRKTNSPVIGEIKLKSAFIYLDSAWMYAPETNAEDLRIRDSLLAKFTFVYSSLKTKPEISERARKYMVQASTATEEKRYADALDLWNKGLSVAPYYPLAYYNRALLKERLEYYSGAIADMKKYLQFAPDANDARTARDKTYEWEQKGDKYKDQTETVSWYTKSWIPTYLISSGYDPGRYYFALNAGGALGMHFGKNQTLVDFYDQNPDGVGTKKYADNKLRFLTAADVELIIKPVKYICVGVFYKTIGGVGIRGTSTETHPNLYMPCSQLGGLFRFNFVTADGLNTPDIYLQYSFATSKLNGSYGVYGSNSIAISSMSLESEGPYNALGLGISFKAGHFYVTESLEYVNIQFDKLTYIKTVGEPYSANPETTGILTHNGEPVTASYNGIVFKLLFGVCF